MIYLLLAYHAPSSLKGLILQLQEEDSYFVIHIDKNSELSIFKRELSGIPNCHFVSSRFRVSWGSFSMVQATLAGFAFIYRKLGVKHRVILLSGLDYPIKANFYIKKYLESHPDSIFIEYEPIPRKLWSATGGGKERFPLFDEVKHQIDFFCGSQWFSIPYCVIPLIFSYIKANPDFVVYFKHVDVPDESFFQTLFLNSGDDYILSNLRNHNLHFIKWDPPYNHPRVMNSSSYRQLIKSKDLFTRKLDPLYSLTLKRKLRQEREGGKEFSFHKDAILFLTNKTSEVINRRFEKLVKEVDFADVFKILVDKSVDGKCPRTIGYKHVFYKKLGYTPLDTKNIVPGSTFYAILYFASLYKGYDNIWLIEDDVIFNGDWRSFFLRYSHNQADLISAYQSYKKDAPEWFWWDYLFSPSKIDDSEKVRTFYPVMRMSDRAIKILDTLLKDGYAGHGEVLVPTLLKIAGLDLHDFYFENDPAIIKGCDDLAVGECNSGSFRFRPIINEREIQGEYLFHPVK